MRPNPSLGPSSSIPIPDSNLEASGGNHGGQSSSDKSLSGSEDGLTLQSVYDLCVSLCKQVTDQAYEIIALKAQIKKLKKQARPVINHHNAWIRAARLKEDIKRSKKKRSVSKQGRKAVKSSKGAPFVPTNTKWDDLDDLEATLNEAMDYTLATEEGKADSKVDEKGESSIKPNESTDKPNESTDKANESTDKQNESTDKANESTDRTKQSTDRQVEGTADFKDETIAQVLVTMSQNKQKEKEKGVELRNVEDIERPRPTSTRSLLTLKPLPKIDPKDKGKKKIEEDESNTESEDI
ncbi:hypothetical protein Tco_1465742, partial [Tanacetum coccineum]